MPINSFLLGPLRQAPKVGHAYRKQVVEAIRVCHDLTVKNEQPESPREAIDLLEKLIEAAVKPRTTSNHTTDDIFVSFSEKLKNYPELQQRMEKARGKDSSNINRAVRVSGRLDSVKKAVKESLLVQRRDHFLQIAWPRMVIKLEISHDAKLAEIVWKFRRICGQLSSIRECPDHLTMNPHFYPSGHQRGTCIQPLGDRDAREEGRRWTEEILVYGDDATGCIKVTSAEDELTSRIYGAVTHDLSTNLESGLTIFKDEKGNLFREDQVRDIFKGGKNIKCFLWGNSGFVEDFDAKTLQDIINRRRVPKLQSPLPASEPNPSNVYTTPTPHLSTITPAASVVESPHKPPTATEGVDGTLSNQDSTPHLSTATPVALVIELPHKRPTEGLNGASSNQETTLTQSQNNPPPTLPNNSPSAAKDAVPAPRPFSPQQTQQHDNRPWWLRVADKVRKRLSKR